MSAARMNKLKALLGRVQERRAAPRLKAVPAAPEPVVSLAPEPSSTLPDVLRVTAPPPEAVTTPPPELVTMPPAAARAEEVAAFLHSSAPPNASRGSEATRSAPTVEDLPPMPALDTLPPIPDFGEEPEGPVTEPPPPAAPAVALAEPVLTAPSARIEPQPMAPAEPVVRVVAPPRVEAPKTFGELLEVSLALRPR
jgi:hypothetical protein